MPSPELALELRAARPVASSELRARVLAVAAGEAPRRRRESSLPQFRRFAFFAVPAALAALIGIAVVHGIVNPRSNAVSPRTGAASSAPAPQPPVVAVGPGERDIAPVDPGASYGRPPTALRAAPIPNTASRLQRYGATLRVQVKNRDELSDATKRAMRVARLLGGYVAEVRYSAPRSGVGSAAIVVRVPVDRVQDAIQEYAGLGTLLAQRVSITDVTKQMQELAKEIARLRRMIAQLEAGGLTPDERPTLQAVKARLHFLTKLEAARARRAQLAKISLALITKRKAAAAPASRFHRTMSDAGSVLVREAEILVYALIVAGPLLLLGAAAMGAAHAGRRRRDAQLLKRT
jgi:Domain of unknown function (DUF4349)